MSFKKKLENYWFYYKYHTLAGALILAVLVMTLVQCVQNVEPDLMMVYAGEQYRATALFEQMAGETVGDINGDGKTKTFCDDIVIPETPKSDADFQMTQKLMLTFVDGGYRVYIMDKGFFESEQYAENFSDLSTVLPQEATSGALEFGGKLIAIPVKNCPYLRKAEIEGDSLYVGIIDKTPGNSSEKNIDKIYDASVKLICEMVK